MQRPKFRHLVLKVALGLLIALPEIAGAQFFNYNQYGDVLAGFRKTGVYAGNYELVVDLGNITNFMGLPSGNSISLTNFTPGQLTDAFPNGYGNLQWSVFATFGGTLSNVPIPQASLWYTLPGTSVTSQTTQAPNRKVKSNQQSKESLMIGVGNGASSIANILAVTNVDNNAVLVREPTTYNNDILTAFIGDVTDPTIGDFGAANAPLPSTVENTTPSSFTAAERSDFYQIIPTGNADPITGLSNGPAYFLGYFILNPNGTMTFTRASAVATNAGPVVSFVMSTITNGFSPLTVVFTNSASGSITNWVWNFGNGTIITNSTGNDVTNTYAIGGNYTVTLTVNGPGGSATVTVANYIVALPSPTVTATLSGSNIVLSGTNCPAGVQYRILATSSLTQTLATWSPVVTNTFLGNGTFTYTNPATNSQTYFRLVSP